MLRILALQWWWLYDYSDVVFDVTGFTSLTHQGSLVSITYFVRRYSQQYWRQKKCISPRIHGNRVLTYHLLHWQRAMMDNPIIFYYTVAPSPEIHITNIKPHHNNKYKYKCKYTIAPLPRNTHTHHKYQTSSQHQIYKQQNQLTDIRRFTNSWSNWEIFKILPQFILETLLLLLIWTLAIYL